VKRKSKKHRRKKRIARTSPKHIQVRYAEMGKPFGDETPEQHTENVKKIGEFVEQRHAELLADLDTLIRQCNPPQMLAHFAYYDRALFEVQQGGSYNPLQQHSVELFQAYFLTIPIEELPVRFTPPDVIMRLNETLRGLHETFPLLGMSKVGGVEDSSGKTRELLAQHMRIHTHGVRNAGYYQQVMRHLRGIFSQLDADFISTASVKLSALITMCENILKLAEQRLNARSTIFKSVNRYTVEDVVRSYCSASNLNDEYRNILLRQCIEHNANVEDARARCIHDADLRLAQLYWFRLCDFVNAYPEPIHEDKLLDVLLKWSYPPAGLVSHNREFLFLDNPVWVRPMVQVGPREFFWPLPELFHSFGIEMLESLIQRDEKLLKKYQDKIRPNYLEDQVTQLCRNAFPDADVRRGLSWHDADGREGETDVLVLVDAIALIIECKSGRITKQARRGAPERLRTEIRKLIEDAAKQSQRFANLLLSTANTISVHDRKGATHQIDANKILKAVRLNITLDFFGPVGCEVRAMLDAGLIDSAVATSPTMPLVHFEEVLHMVETPVERLHYFARRAEIERNIELLADEEDFLALYLATGFNLGDLEFQEKTRLMISSLSKDLEPYLKAFHARSDATKPRRRYTQWWSQLLERLQRNTFSNWTLAAFVLLDVRHDQQREFEAAVRKMLKNVRSNWHRKAHLNAIVLANGPEKRRNAVVAVGVKRVNRDERNTIIENALSRAEIEAKTKEIVAICLSAEKTFWPYSALFYSPDPESSVAKRFVEKSAAPSCVVS
jgi:hypothetical protein